MTDLIACLGSGKGSWSHVKRLVEEIPPQYAARQGGYTRIINLGARKSDGAKMVIIELVK